MKLKDCEILLTEPRGFCAGVERAIGIVNRAIEMFDEEIYVKHEVVHNKNVIEELTKKGVVFIESLTEVPDKSILIYSAHGVSKEVADIAQKKNLTIFDATCPLVTKVHFEIHKYARENIDVILIGHNGHPEVEGTMGQYTSKAGKIYLVESKDDVETLEIINTKISYVTQTTLSVDDTQDIVDALKEKYPHIQGPKKSDICYATQNRQEAVKKILSDIPSECGSFSNPTGGYFMTYNFNKPIATKVQTICEEMGLYITPASSLFPKGKCLDNVLRIAPTYVSVNKLELAMNIFITAVQIAHFDIEY